MSVGNSKFVRISVVRFLKALDDVALPYKKLEIEEYEDNDEFLHRGLIYYVIIPRIKQKHEESSLGNTKI